MIEIDKKLTTIQSRPLSTFDFAESFSQMENDDDDIEENLRNQVISVQNKT